MQTKQLKEIDLKLMLLQLKPIDPLRFGGGIFWYLDGGGLGGGAASGSGNVALPMLVGWLTLVRFSSSPAL